MPVFVDTNVLLFARDTSEDLQHDFDLDGVRVVDAFRTPAGAVP